MTTTIIESYLKAIDQATFQKMMNHLLHLEGYKFISSPGSVIGKNKTSKGSPDSFFEDGENFIFCEATTQERLNTGETFFNKLKKDIDHCFNVKVTGINKDKISKVILAFTEEIKPNEYDELKSKVKTNNDNAELNIYSIQELPFRILYYPGFAEKYIAGVQTTKGTIYTLPDFLETSKKGLQPSLINPFVGREDEIKNAKELLANNDILILSGIQGVGKSKLAIHLAEIFENEMGFEPRVIASSPVPLWDDLSNFILPDRKYFIVFDDANKALPNLEYLLEYVKSRELNSTKIVITVRDYVRQDLNRYILNHSFNETIIKKFEDKQIEEIINKSLPNGIQLDPIVLDRIITLAKGNSRLALMATSSIIKNNDVRILDSAINLYDEYFQKVKFDVSFLSDKDSLTALGILSFFDVLNKNNEELKTILENDFGIDWNNLWEKYIKSEQVELVDIFSNEIVKVSDQVLSSFVFFKTFIDKNTATISYSNWIEKFIDKYNRKINKSLTDIINTFGFNEIKDKISSQIIEVQKNLKVNNEKLYKFFEIYWYFREVDTLLFVKNWIDNLEIEEIEIENIKYTYKDNDFIWPSKYIDLLKNFWHYSTPFLKDAIDLGLQLAFSQPSRIPELLKHLKESISYKRYDFRINYERQHVFIDVLNNNVFNDRQKAIAEQIFLSITPSFLKWEYTQSEGKDERGMTIYNFRLAKTPALMELRSKIITNIFNLLPKYESKVLEILGEYFWTSKYLNSEIHSDEQQLITSFFRNNFSNKTYSHCKIINDYVKTLQYHKIKPIQDWSSFINSESMKIAKIFVLGYDEERIEFDKMHDQKRKEIKSFIANKDIKFIEKIFKEIDNICSESSFIQNTYWFDENINYLFNETAEKDSKLFLRSLELVILGKYKFNLQHGSIIIYPIRKKLVPLKDFYNLINRYDYKQKQFFKQMFFEAIPENEIDEFILQEFIGYIFSISTSLYIHELENFYKFDKQFNTSKTKLPSSALKHSNIITYITEILLFKISEIDVFFGRHVCKNCVNFFTDEISILKKVFIHHKKRDTHYDYEGTEMASISNTDHYFLIEYLTEVTKDKKYIEFKFDNLNLSFVWDLPEYEDILNEALEIIIAKAPVWSNFEHQANFLFKKMKLEPEQQEKAYSYISNFISKYHSSQQHILAIMNVVTYSFNDQVLRFLKEFLLLNKDIEFIRTMCFEKGGAFSGSRVPIIEGQIIFTKKIVEMVKSLPSPLDYVEHLKYWEQKLEWAKKDKQQEMKRDFTGLLDLM